MINLTDYIQHLNNSIWLIDKLLGLKMKLKSLCMRLISLSEIKVRWLSLLNAIVRQNILIRYWCEPLNHDLKPLNSSSDPALCSRCIHMTHCNLQETEHVQDLEKTWYNFQGIFWSTEESWLFAEKVSRLVLQEYCMGRIRSEVEATAGNSRVQSDL